MNAQQPEREYHRSNEIRIFYSFEEVSEREAEDIIKQSPVQRLKNTIELILRTYQTSREELQYRISSNEIRIIHQE